MRTHEEQKIADLQIDLVNRYYNYLDHADDGEGNDITTNQPLLTYDEWLQN